jgi:hypothetical protein
MSRTWTPQSHGAVTEAGMVIKVKLDGVPYGGFTTAFEERQLCIRGRHDSFGSFEIKFEIPPDYNRMMFKATFVKGVLRIEVPPGREVPFLADFPKTMLIYCDGCGKHFDIVITGKGPGNYPCPAGGKVQIFDLEALVNQVIEQSNKMFGKKRGRQ